MERMSSGTVAPLQVARFQLDNVRNDALRTEVVAVAEDLRGDAKTVERLRNEEGCEWSESRTKSEFPRAMSSIEVVSAERTGCKFQKSRKLKAKGDVGGVSNYLWIKLAPCSA